MRTIGVAVAVPEPYGEHLRAKRRSFGDPLADAIPSHVTLIPPTAVTDEQLDDLVVVLDEVATVMPSFTMSLRGTGSFRPVSPVVFVAVAEGISYTEMLATAIREALALEEPEFPFHPHVTVAHHLDDDQLDVAAAELARFECEFAVTEFSLYFHDDIEGWQPVRSFGLMPAV